MELMLWTLQTRDSFAFAWPVLSLVFLLAFFTYVDFPLLIMGWFGRRAFGKGDTFTPAPLGGRPGALVIIPSLLRNEEDFNACTVTAHSAATNKYPGELTIVVSIDGINDFPHLTQRMHAWAEEHNRKYPPNVKVVISGTEKRGGKMMAVEAGVDMVKHLVATGAMAKFPPLYYSIDGDGELGPHAIERLAARLTQRHLVTGRMRRVVAGKCMIRPELFWQGLNTKSLRSWFTVSGQIYRQVAREFVVANVPRFNMRPKPQVCIPGGLYCTWSDILVQAPRFMGFMQEIKLKDWLKWWLGHPPPCFAEWNGRPNPEALTGPSDDTCISFMAQMSDWKDGKLCLEFPRTPLHAFGRMFRSYFLERTPGYEPEARCYTYTPDTIKGIWVQRVRWNASRFECSYRFKNAFAFHWAVGFPMTFHWLLLGAFFQAAFYYVFLPFAIIGTRSALLAFAIGYFFQCCMSFYFTSLALIIESDRKKYWPVYFGIPFTPLYAICINFFAGLNGVMKDLFLFGNSTKFAPEWTFIKGGTVRFALLFRIRRFFALCVRSVVVGDVPFGRWWFGWRETPWTPNGYEGWTTGKRRRIVPPVRVWLNRKELQKHVIEAQEWKAP